MTNNNNNNNNSWTKDFRAAILLWGAEDCSQPPGGSQTGVGGSRTPSPGQGGDSAAVPAQATAPHHRHPLPTPLLFPGDPPGQHRPQGWGSIFSPRPCRVGGMWGGPDLLLIFRPHRPPLRSELDSRHRYSHGGGSHGQLRTHGHDTHATHRQTHRPCWQEPHAPPGRAKASRSGRGWGGYFLATLL